MLMQQRISERVQLRGAFQHDQLGLLPLAAVLLYDRWGNKQRWGDYKLLIEKGRTKMVQDLLRLEWKGEGTLLFVPYGEELPLQCARALLFRDLCLSLLANLPELRKQGVETDMLRVTHAVGDDHHLFEVKDGAKGMITHTWGSLTKMVQWDRDSDSIDVAVANHLEAETSSVWVLPHPWLTRMRPLWAGKRRWKQSRKSYKKLIGKRREAAAIKAEAQIGEAWKANHASMARALEQLKWKRIHRMEDVTAYQAQTVVRLKNNRLRLWAGKENNFKCLAAGCTNSKTLGSAHLAWDCDEAQAHWRLYCAKWEGAKCTSWETKDTQEEAIKKFFGFKLQKMPGWLTTWGVEQEVEPWDQVTEVACSMWALGCAVTLTALWRWNVDRLHPEGKKAAAIADQLRRYQTSVVEAFERFRLGLYPLTTASYIKIWAAGEILKHWRRKDFIAVPEKRNDVVRVGVFDGGSRGNPGAGGSGSIIVEDRGAEVSPAVLWAAATALGSRATTNNVAEFTGLHRLLARAIKMEWEGIHVVGDSALILKMMKERTMPKTRKMQYWYKIARKLADRCKVESWTHHYRTHNKMVDALANKAMDTGKSTMYGTEGDTERVDLRAEVSTYLANDFNRWREEQEDGRRAAQEECGGSIHPEG
ncbi:hypothetical protein PF010_g1549 [Phytophthora fragariae]|uniref:RNase H type-1 domain-containing protein n=2 Tax=Phytophthora fragariae TaxID=53985 RepID=A0A6A3Y2B9_9STRA|nr:hypothetical protein PF009_g5224 [Phytophthora fragariae]KAE9127053.1 hypothetical protein PF007_g5756 [Phytophthora fragariae]KAE9136822.1 hypothetical protein PF010_g1549 [Phytophthora fragariae]KAE9208602.1 hypothetical protein PF002_g19348 [Phytophthora fragariae]